LVELLVVIAIVVILAGLLLPALSAAKGGAQTAICRGNLKQLQLGFKMFADDNGFFPSNNYVHDINQGTLRLSTWAPLSLGTNGEASAVLLGCLQEYVPQLAVYRCPAHRIRSERFADAHEPVPTAHSYNLSIWLNSLAEPRGYMTEAELGAGGKGTSEFFAFIDTHEGSIVDPAFGIYPATDPYRKDIWVDLPADRHRQGAAISFLDGHVERWRWRVPKMFERNGQKARATGDREDLRRLQQAIPDPKP
jgi:prepilin-type processing-associated H-X9-DG protein